MHRCAVLRAADALASTIRAAVRDAIEPGKLNDVTEKTQRGIQSVEVAGRILEALASRRNAAPLSELAAAAGLSTAQAHTYLVSLTKLGLVKRDAWTGYYEPGPLSLRLGLMFIERQEAYRVAVPYAASLARQLKVSVAVCVAGAQGPMIVHYERGTDPLHVNLHIGTVMSLRSTSTGRLFSAFLKPEQLAPMMQSQGLAQHHPGLGHADTPAPDLETSDRLQDVRKRGMARSVDMPSPGIGSLSAPIFDGQGNLQLALTVIGPSTAMDMAWSGPMATDLRNVCRQITEILSNEAKTHAP